MNSQGHKVVIRATPLKIEFLNKAGDVAVVLNDNAQLVVEPLRVKKERIDDEDGNAVEVVSLLLCLYCFCDWILKCRQVFVFR